MARDLLLALGLPLGLLLLLIMAIERWGDGLPPWARRLSQHSSLLWNIGIGLILSLSLLRWLLQR